MRPLPVLLWALWASAAVAQDAPPCPGGIALTRAQIETAGLVYLSDLFRLLPPLRRSTLDALTWQTADAAGVPFAEPAALVLVDGVPVDLDFFGEAEVEMLAVPLPEIQRVAYCPSSEPAAGVWAGRGTLLLETRRVAPGLSSRGTWVIGNEIGDPGPFRYVEGRATPNVDKSGPDGEAAVRYEAGQLGSDGMGRALRVYATDPALMPRTGTATRRLASNERIVSGMLRGSAGGTRRHAAVLAGRYVSDFFFL
ncbi:MAG TPA: hypothetical protein VD962_08905, partial [Rubricoccaceae bacterium]|nr:hypothetical protein [Rubricoccaceae bacterium]